MSHIITLSNLVIRKRPKAYKARDAAYSVGGKRGFYLSSFPRPYPMTSSQRKVREVADACGIKSGIKKADLQIKMKDCVGPKMRK